MGLPCLVIVTCHFLGIKENISYHNGVLKYLITIQQTQLKKPKPNKITYKF
jgi:hypothetical protein